jgi:hypothetical protein
LPWKVLISTPKDDLFPLNVCAILSSPPSG